MSGVQEATQNDSCQQRQWQCAMYLMFELNKQGIQGTLAEPSICGKNIFNLHYSH
jgi:hypothetical protein